MAIVTCFLRLSSSGMLSIINNYPNQRQNIFCSTLTIVCPKHDQLFPAQGTAFTLDLAKQKDTYSIKALLRTEFLKFLLWYLYREWQVTFIICHQDPAYRM